MVSSATACGDAALPRCQDEARAAWDGVFEVVTAFLVGSGGYRSVVSELVSRLLDGAFARGVAGYIQPFRPATRRLPGV